MLVSVGNWNYNPCSVFIKPTYLVSNCLTKLFFRQICACHFLSHPQNEQSKRTNENAFEGRFFWPSVNKKGASFVVFSAITIPRLHNFLGFRIQKEEWSNVFRTIKIFILFIWRALQSEMAFAIPLINWTMETFSIKLAFWTNLIAIWWSYEVKWPRSQWRTNNGIWLLT